MYKNCEYRTPCGKCRYLMEHAARNNSLVYDEDLLCKLDRKYKEKLRKPSLHTPEDYVRQCIETPEG